MTKYFPTAQVALAILFSGIAIFVVSAAGTYGTVPYHVDVARSHLESGLSTNSIPGKILFMNETLNELQAYHGNSGWPYPDETTNIDNTKRILSESINEAIHQIPTDDKDNWMILPHPALNDYLNQQINDSADRLGYYNASYMWNPANSFLLVAIIFTAVGTIGFGIGGCLYNEHKRWN